eukprot:scaffold18606_cov60-Phaeocystis_antarctica.AAC.4
MAARRWRKTYMPPIVAPPPKHPIMNHTPNSADGTGDTSLTTGRFSATRRLGLGSGVRSKAVLTLEVRGASWYQTPCDHRDKAFSRDGHEGHHHRDEEESGPDEEIENAEGVAPQRGRGGVKRAAGTVPCHRLALRAEKRNGDEGTRKTHADEYERPLAQLPPPPPEQKQERKGERAKHRQTGIDQHHQTDRERVGRHHEHSPLEATVVHSIAELGLVALCPVRDAVFAQALQRVAPPGLKQRQLL